MKRNPLLQLNKDLEKYQGQLLNCQHRLSDLRAKVSATQKEIEQYELEELNTLLKRHNLKVADVLPILSQSEQLQ